MDDCGSKLVVKSATVKEQRVNDYGYLHKFVIYLRCILITLEISLKKIVC